MSKANKHKKAESVSAGIGHKCLPDKKVCRNRISTHAHTSINLTFEMFCAALFGGV